MTAFDPASLALWTEGWWTAPPASAPVGFTIDTRQLRPGQVFVALKTDRRAGRAFLAAARRAGAAGAIVDAADPAEPLPQLVVAEPLAAFQAIARQHRRRFPGPVVGVSGSAGKTSTKELLSLLLGGGSGAADDRLPVLATEGNLNNRLGVPLTLTRLDPAVHRFAVVEAGIGGPGEMAPLAAMIEPDLAIITLVGPAHLAELGGLEEVAREKASLLAAVRGPGMAIFPSSCLAFAPFRELNVRTLVVAPAVSGVPAAPAGAQRAEGAVAHQGETTTVTLSWGAPPASFTFCRVSDGMAQNAALALCAALELGTAPDLLRSRLRQWRPAPLRGEMRREGGKLFYIDCYNANPASMADALAAFGAVASASEPRLYVLGSMEELGSEAGRYHRELGRSLRLRAGDRLFVVGAEAEAIRAGAVEAGNAPGQIAVVGARAPVAARRAALRGAVFVKGSRKHALERLLEGAAHA